MASEMKGIISEASDFFLQIWEEPLKNRYVKMGSYLNGLVS